MPTDDFLFRGINLQHGIGISKCPVVSSTLDVAGVFDDMALLHQQVWVAGTLDLKSRLICWNMLGEGSRPVIRPIDVFAGAILNSGKGAFIVRNSPRGSLSRSLARYDRELIDVICATGAMMGYALLDFVVLERNGCRSVFEEVQHRYEGRTNNSDTAALSGMRMRLGR